MSRPIQISNQKVTVFIRKKPYETLESLTSIEIPVTSNTTILILKTLICKVVQESNDIAVIDKAMYLDHEQIGEITDLRETCSYKDNARVLSLREKHPFPPYNEVLVVFKVQPVEALQIDVICKRNEFYFTGKDNVVEMGKPNSNNISETLEELVIRIDSLKALAAAIKNVSSKGYLSEYNQGKANECLSSIKKGLPVMNKILKEFYKDSTDD